MAEKNNNKPLSRSEKEKFKQLLLDKRKELIGDVGNMECNTLNGNNDTSQHSPLHLADISSDNYERENLLGLMESEIKLLIEVEKALARIDKGNYGICEGNGEFIPKARLKAIPWTKYCVSCANQMEKFSKTGIPSRKKYNFASGFDDPDIDHYSNRSILKQEYE